MSTTADRAAAYRQHVARFSYGKESHASFVHSMPAAPGVANCQPSHFSPDLARHCAGPVEYDTYFAVYLCHAHSLAAAEEEAEAEARGGSW